MVDALFNVAVFAMLGLCIVGFGAWAHKRVVGQTVFLSSSFGLNIPGGAYIVTRKLPERDGEYVYQVKSANEPHQRVVRESEISDVP